jgi:hypothetical protein
MADRVLICPHWLFLIIAGGLAVALKPAPRRKFSLRDLLVFVTVAAIAIGMITILVRFIPKGMIY